MYEVELKVRADHERLRTALAELDVEQVGRVHQIDTYYDAPHREFAETDEALRIRRETDAEGQVTTKLTYKGPLVEAESKTREEFETLVGDDEAIAGVLEHLGFSPAGTVEKDRERYRVDGFTVSLDAVEGLGTFCEVERETEEADVERVREGAVDLLAALGLDADDQIRTSYFGLLLASREE